MLGRELVLRRARGYAPLPVAISGGTAPPVLAVGGAPEEHRGAGGRLAGVRQPAHRRPGDASARRRRSRRRVDSLRAPAAIDRRRRGGRRAPGLRSRPRYRARARGCRCRQVQHHHGARRRLHGGERADRPGARRGVGRHRLRPRRHGLGRRVPARGGRRLRAGRALPPVPAAGRRAGGARAAARGARPAVRDDRAGRGRHRRSSADAFTPGEQARDASKALARRAERAGDDQRGTAVRRRGGAGWACDSAARSKGRRRWSSRRRSTPAETGRYAIEPGRRRGAIRAGAHLAGAGDASSTGSRWSTAMLHDVAARRGRRRDRGARSTTRWPRRSWPSPRRAGEPRVVLTRRLFPESRPDRAGGCARCETAGFRPYWHQRVPPNDGGIALGQIAALAAPSGVGHASTR